jgi:uncharacterized protein (UPF0264 family)
MTQLLVSVRSGEEAATALAGGANIIDVKEPLRGSLGAADPAVWRDVLQAVAGQVPTSAALGEWTSPQLHSLAVQTAGFDFVKVGLSHWHGAAVDTWQTLHRAIPVSATLVPVVYADAPAASCDSLPAMFSRAIQLAKATCSLLILIDTFEKAGRTLLDFATVSELQALLDQARAKQVRVALAGALRADSIASLLPVAPAILGVRGAVCVAGRSGQLDSGRVKSLADLIFAAREKRGS